MKARDKILEVVYLNPGMLITDLIRASKSSIKNGMLAINTLLKEGIIREDVLRRGKKTISRRIYPRFDTETGLATFSLVELARSGRFYEKHSSLKGPLSQFAESIPVSIVLIFGSFARGGETKSSDIDLLLLSERVDKKLRSAVEKNGEIAFATVDNRPSIRIERLSDFGKNIKDSFHQTILREHIIIKGATEFVALLSKLQA